MLKKYIYLSSQFLLFAVVTFYKVNESTEIQNTEPLLLGEIWGQVPGSLWSQYFHQPINP